MFIFLGNSCAKNAHALKQKVTSFEAWGYVSWLLASGIWVCSISSIHFLRPVAIGGLVELMKAMLAANVQISRNGSLFTPFTNFLNITNSRWKSKDNRGSYSKISRFFIFCCGSRASMLGDSNKDRNSTLGAACCSNCTEAPSAANNHAIRASR